MIVTVTLNAAVDRVLAVPGLRLGKTTKGKLVASVPAGKGVNVARYLAALGVPSVVAGFVGRRELRTYEESFRDTPVTSALIEVPSHTRVSTTLLSDKKTGETHIREAGAPVPGEQKTQLHELLLELSAEHGPFVFAGSLPPDFSPAEFAALITGLKSRDAVVIVDTSGTALESAVTAGCDLVTPNEEELSELIGETTNTPAAIVEAARLLSQNAPEMAVKRGRKGGILVTPDVSLSASLDVANLDVLSTVGAGDAFLAGLLAAREEGEAPEKQLASAVAAGCASVLERVTGDIDAVAYEQFLEAVTIKEI